MAKLHMSFCGNLVLAKN